MWLWLNFIMRLDETKTERKIALITRNDHLQHLLVQVDELCTCAFGLKLLACLFGVIGAFQ